MHGKQIIGLVLFSLITACSPVPVSSQSKTPSSADSTVNSLPSASPQAVEEKSQTLQADSRSSRSHWSGIESSLEKEKPYAEFREMALTSGWVPVLDPACKSNVGGAAEICDRLPELVSCSADGYCKMQWQHRQSSVKLEVFTYGDYGKWNVPGQQDALRMTSWSFITADQRSTETSACPAQEFEPFLQAFASDQAIRNTFTLPQIQVTELANEDLDTRVVTVPKEQYEDFSIAYADGAFHFVDHQGNIDPAPLMVSREETPARMRLNLVERANGDYFVKYVYGMSEGNSWVFKRQNDCWYLAEDPEAPSP